MGKLKGKPIRTFSYQELVGLDDSSMIPWQGDSKIRIHKDLEISLSKLVQAAKGAGFDLALASGHRSYERQLTIWNEKCQGIRPIYDRQGRVLNSKKLPPESIVEAIMHWSAIPGTSRHHWGSDIDVFDLNSVPANYQIELSAQEVSKGGIFYPFHQWLDQLIDQQKSYGFWRPYTEDIGGVAPEKWHLSFAPLSTPMDSCYDFDVFLKVIENDQLQFREYLIEDAEFLFQNYVKKTTPPPF